MRIDRVTGWATTLDYGVACPSRAKWSVAWGVETTFGWGFVEGHCLADASGERLCAVDAAGICGAVVAVRLVVFFDARAPKGHAVAVEHLAREIACQANVAVAATPSWRETGSQTERVRIGTTGLALRGALGERPGTVLVEGVAKDDR